MRRTEQAALASLALRFIACRSEHDELLARDVDAAFRDTTLVDGGGQAVDALGDEEQTAPSDPFEHYTLRTTRRVGIVWGATGAGANLAFAGFGFGPGAWQVDLFPLTCVAGTLRNTSSGACLKVDCEVNEQIRTASAGTISVGRRGASDLIMHYPAYIADSSNKESFEPWVEGTVVEVTATGGAEVPSFAASVTLPPDAEWFLAEPLVSDVLEHRRSRDLLVRWNPRVKLDAVRIALTERRPMANHRIGVKSVECRFAADAGEGAIPSALLADFGVGSSIIDVFGENVTLVRLASGDPVIVSAWRFNELPAVRFVP